MSEPKFTGIYTGQSYKPFYFSTQELGSKHAYDIYGEKILRYINTLATFTADQLRHKFGPTTINNWAWKGKRQYSGLRLKGEPHYRASSDHSFGNALDMVFKNARAQDVRNYIEDNPDLFPFITFIEEGKNVNWLHISVSNVSNTFRMKHTNSLIFWSLDTGEYREVPRSDDFDITKFWGSHNA